MPLEELRTALRQAVELDEPPLRAGPAAVFARADRVRTRHRVTIVASGIAVLGVALSAAAAAVDRTGAASTAAAPSAAAAAVSAPAPSSPSVRRSDVPADVMLATLRRLLPAGVATSEPFSQVGFAEFVLTDAAGRGKVQINVQPQYRSAASPGRGLGSDPMDLFSCAKRPMPAGTHCTDSTLPDGTLVVLTDGPSEDAGHDRIKLRMADIYRPDNVRIVIGTWNAVHEKTNTANRAEPPLTVQQLQAIATDPTWPV